LNSSLRRADRVGLARKNRRGRIDKLKNWSLMNVNLGQRGSFLSGTISGKPDLCTSWLVLFQPAPGYAVTGNTIVMLGKNLDH